MLSKLVNKIHILQNIYLKNKHFIKKKSYAMDGEDLAIDQYLKKKDKGFYVDIGAHHPIQRNNTQLLFKRGWEGINIDVNQFSIDLFEYLRPKDFNYNLAVSNKDEIIEMYFQKHLSQLSTIEEKQAKKVFQGYIKKSKINAFTLDSILEETKIDNLKIDLLDIDVEGADFKVLEGFSITKYMPELICVEIHEKEINNSKISKYLGNFRYELIWSGVFSHIFKSKA